MLIAPRRTDKMAKRDGYVDRVAKPFRRLIVRISVNTTVRSVAGDYKHSLVKSSLTLIFRKSRIYQNNDNFASQAA
ncbi:hypothetical protein [Myxosarcina sp. GI1]|uniref:hypothetical protein n=1 Tax=Myxosarcina sp. GI1 TaxID=1541065 RepID=UPI00055CEBA6|nr:hypothetical protein [Myxosarcina sp. GI1]